MAEKKLSASTVNVRLSAIRKLVGEARRNGILDAEQATKMADVPNVRQQGTRLGNWLTRDQTKELLAVTDRSTIKGKRDYCILALGRLCSAPKRAVDANARRHSTPRGRWVIVDLVGKGSRVRTVTIPVWVENAINAWQTAAKIEDGRLLRPLSKSGRILGEELGDWAIWSVVEASPKEIGDRALWCA